MAVGHQLGLRLFIEGIEVPVIGASITIAANAPAACSIQVIATDRILDLLPRSVVHLFFYDFVEAISPDQARTVAGIKQSVPFFDSGSVQDELNSRYKLLYMGELQGLSFQKDAGTRSVILNCIDFSNYWDTTYQYNFKGSLLGGRRHAAFIGANANFFTGPLGHGVGTIAALLNGRSVNFPNMKGLLAGIVRLLETIGGAYHGDTTFRGANPFTSIAELRLKILQQITAAEKDTSSAKLFARKTFNMWMNRQMGSLGKLVTFRGLVQILQKFIFHDIMPCPVARYVPKTYNLKKKKSYAVRLDKDPRSRKTLADAKRLRLLVRSAKASLGLLLRSVTPAGRRDNTKSAFKELSQSLSLIRNMTVSVPKGLGIEKHIQSTLHRLFILAIFQLFTGNGNHLILRYLLAG